MAFAVTLLMLLAPATAWSAVYRCPAAAGTVHYTDRPCPGGQRLSSNSAPQPDTSDTPAPPPDPAPQRQPRRRPATTPPPESCPGVRLLSVQPYSYQTTATAFQDGVPYHQVVKHQCAAVRLWTDAYYGLLRESVAERLRRHLVAVFADGSTAAATGVTLQQAPDRMGVDAKLAARACFGTGPVAVIRIRCH